MPASACARGCRHDATWWPVGLKNAPSRIWPLLIIPSAFIRGRFRETIPLQYVEGDFCQTEPGGRMRQQRSGQAETLGGDNGASDPPPQLSRWWSGIVCVAAPCI